MVKIISIKKPEAVKMAKEILRSSGIILYPTDTVYGLGADATNAEAIKKIFSIKNRKSSSPISIVLDSIEKIGDYAIENPLAFKIAGKFLPGPLTLILKKKNNLPEILTGGSEKIGVRIPDHKFCLELARMFGKPFTTTSANISGNPVKKSVQEILTDLPNIDLVIDGGLLPDMASTVVDVTGEKPIVVREGIVPRESFDF